MTDRKFYAHSTPRPDRSDWQLLAAHLLEVGEGASRIAAKFGASKAALLAGLGHDLGKYCLPFQRRLSGSSERVDHSIAGAREVLDLAEKNLGYRVMCELIAYAIAGHHAGLPDRRGSESSLEGRANGLHGRDLAPAWRAEIGLGLPEPSPRGFRLLRSGENGDDPHQWFRWALLGRMIFSVLVDADRRNTEDFAVSAGEAPKPRDWPALPALVDDFIARLDRHLEDLRRDSKDSDLNRLRAEILASVTARAEDGRGCYTLTVPTGGGKTLTVTRFALGHARKWGLDRIIYSIPFTGARIETSCVLSQRVKR